MGPQRRIVPISTKKLRKRKCYLIITLLRANTFSSCQQHRQKCSITAPQYSNVDHLCDIDRENASNNDKDVVVKVHHILHSYYKVARQRFVDCVRMQVADTLLVTGLKTPLTLFSAKFVTNMEPKALEEVAGEDVAMKRRREDLERRTNQLREGKRIIG